MRYLRALQLLWPPLGSDFSTNFLKRNCVLLKTSLKVLIGFWVIDGISSPQGENQNLSIIFHLLKTTNREQAGLTSMSAQLMRRVTLTNPSAALMGSMLGTHAGEQTSALHLHRLNKHVRVQGKRDHWESAPSDDALPQAMKWECCLFRGDCQSKAAVKAKGEFPYKKIDWKLKNKKRNWVKILVIEVRRIKTHITFTWSLIIIIVVVQAKSKAAN